MIQIAYFPSNLFLLPSKRSNNYNIKKAVILVILIIFNSSVFSQFYAGNSFTDRGVTITPGYLFSHNLFTETETLINGTNDFVLTQYSLFAGKQFIITGSRGNEENCIKIKTAIGATLKKSEEVFMDEKYNSESNSWRLYEAKVKTSKINLNLKLELGWFNKPFDYFIVVGYNNGTYTGIGWRGSLNKRQNSF